VTCVIMNCNVHVCSINNFWMLSFSLTKFQMIPIKFGSPVTATCLLSFRLLYKAFRLKHIESQLYQWFVRWRNQVSCPSAIAQIADAQDWGSETKKMKKGVWYNDRQYCIMGSFKSCALHRVSLGWSNKWEWDEQYIEHARERRQMYTIF
jgi:hypothetical protein